MQAECIKRVSGDRIGVATSTYYIGGADVGQGKKATGIRPYVAFDQIPVFSLLFPYPSLPRSLPFSGVVILNWHTKGQRKIQVISLSIQCYGF